MAKAIIIPYRGTVSDKSRLRSDLNLTILEQLLSNITQNVIYEALKVKGIDKVYVLTQKSELEFYGNFEILIDRVGDLNGSILTALREIDEETIVITMADLPLITSTHIENILENHIKTSDVVLAPTEDKGTSLVCFSKTHSFPGLFGKNSSLRFKEFFENNSIGIALLTYNEAYRDIDTFKDLIKIANNELLPNDLHSIFKECVEFEREN
ncbi:MAG: NTP transferase domain-containing protein [Candidatus Heimdallarchaeota archaeon]|nr:NTP transferase domain-containing protein [Candidatus Heimdallarchaeota archaeon]